MAEIPLKLAGVGTLTALALTLLATPASAAPPTNDDFASAEVVTALPFMGTSSIVEATREPNEPDCFSWGSPTVWYSYTAAESGWLGVDLVGSDYDTTLAVYTGESGALTPALCNDDSEGRTSAVNFEATAGTTYHFQVSGWVSSVGSVVLNVRTTPAPPPPPPPPAQLTSVSATVTSATVDRKGVVTVGGTVVCDQPSYANIGVLASQTSRRFTARGNGNSTEECGTTPTPFVMTMASSTGVSFVAGKMTATVTAEAFGTWPDSQGFVETSGTQEVRLRAVR